MTNKTTCFMKVNELRIGNYIRYREAVVKVTGINTENFHEGGVYFDYHGRTRIGCSEDRIDPVMVSEDWLLKVGFKKHVDDNKTPFWNKYPLQLCWHPVDGFEYFHRQFTCYFIKMKYVHQVQNLYYCLTGKELTE